MFWFCMLYCICFEIANFEKYNILFFSIKNIWLDNLIGNGDIKT